MYFDDAGQEFKDKCEIYFSHHHRAWVIRGPGCDDVNKQDTMGVPQAGWKFVQKVRHCKLLNNNNNNNVEIWFWRSSSHYWLTKRKTLRCMI